MRQDDWDHLEGEGVGLIAEGAPVLRDREGPGSCHRAAGGLAASLAISPFRREASHFLLSVMGTVRQLARYRLTPAGALDFSTAAFVNDQCPLRLASGCVN